MTNFLIIPHSPALNVRVRSFEIAKALSAQGHSVHYWHFDNSDRTAPMALARIAISEFVRTDEVFPFYGVNVLRTSHLYKPSWLAQSWNNRQLERIVLRYKIDYVVSASFSDYRPPDFVGVRYVFDCVDDTVGDPDLSDTERTRRVAIMRSQVVHADQVIASSRSIEKKLMADYGARPEQVIYIPNGVSLSEYRTVEPQAVERFRRKYGLAPGKRVASFIGNHAKWSGIDFVHKLFAAGDPRLADWSLVLAGPTYRTLESSPSILNLGTIPWSEVPALVNISDCGLLPFDINDFTTNALPLKVLEYTAMGKPVLATPLNEVSSLGWANIILRVAEAKLWADTLAGLDMPEQSVVAIDEYDWAELAKLIPGSGTTDDAGTQR